MAKSIKTAYQTLFLQHWKNFKNDLKKLSSTCSKHTIHQLRVYSRRLEIHLWLLEETLSKDTLKPCHQAIRQITKRLSNIRSLDVSVQSLENNLVPSSKSQRNFKKILIDQLNQQKQKLRNQLDRKDICRLKNQLMKLKINSEVKTIKRGSIFTSLKNRAKTLNKGIEKAAILCQKNRGLQDLHRLRIIVKKYRYLLEIQVHIKKSGKRKLATSKKWHQRLGELNDQRVLLELVEPPSILPKSKKALLTKKHRAFCKKLKKQIDKNRIEVLRQLRAEKKI